jgi:hypothetical protein
MEEFLTFQKYTNKESVLELEKILKENKIIYLLEDHSTSVDSNILGNASVKEFRIKIKNNDFEKVDKLLQVIILKELDQVDQNHYLFKFSDNELFEIITQKDEWSRYDYLLAQKILQERGKEINPEIIQLIKKQRIAELSKPEESQKGWIFAGYLFASLGGFLGVIIGWHLLTHKKTLPNGDRVYTHAKSDRAHGNRIAIIGFIMFLVLIGIRLFYFYEESII